MRYLLKNIFRFILVLLPTLGYGQMVLNEEGTGIEDLVPEHWMVLDSCIGDLNKDGIEDLVLIVQDTDTANIEKNEGLGTDFIDHNPRTLGIYFGTEMGGFHKQLQSDSFIITRDSPTMDEPLDYIKITDRGVLEIGFKFWFSAGSWFMSFNQYKFRFQDNAFALIGYESEETHRGSGDTMGYSINFLSKKMSITTGNIGEDDFEEEHKKFTLDSLKTIRSLVRPFNWEFEGLYL